MEMLPPCSSLGDGRDAGVVVAAVVAAVGAAAFELGEMEM